MDKSFTLNGNFKPSKNNLISSQTTNLSYSMITLGYDHFNKWFDSKQIETSCIKTKDQQSTS